MPPPVEKFGDPAQDGADTLSWHARELYNDLRLVPLLRQLMLTSCRLTDALGGAISIVDPDGERYMKVAERGTACRLGQSFPLQEGVTGQVMMSRRPVVLARYTDVVTGHLPAGNPARDGAVVAVPIWWCGDVVGVNVVFAGGPRDFSDAEVDQLELLTQVVAPGLITAVLRERPIAAAHGRPVTTHDAAHAAHPRPLASVAEVASSLMSLAERAAGPRSAHGRMDIAVLRRGDDLRLLVHDESPGREGIAVEPRGAWRELVDTTDGKVTVRHDGDRGGQPSSDTTGAAPGRGGTSLPFSVRELQVARLLARGLSDRAVALDLLISPKTVEKHVGAVLRKTGTTSRTAAVVRALERGWLDGSAVSIGP